MKKTEKIEVRLSHEEKTALTNLAEQENRSVSDLVRGLIERYMSINTTRLPRKTPWLLLGAIGLCGFFAGHLATYFIAKSHSNSHSPVYSMGVNVDMNGITFPLVAESNKLSEFIIPAANGDILIKAQTEKLPDNLATVFIELCRKSEASCELIARPSLQFDPNRASSLKFEEANGNTVFLTLSPPPRRKES